MIQSPIQNIIEKPISNIVKGINTVSPPPTNVLTYQGDILMYKGETLTYR